MIEEKVIKNCKLRERNLLRAAKLANHKPDTGVTILKKGAYFVIKDCSNIALKYMAHLAYGSYTDPLNELKGKFTETEIIDFVSRSSKDNHTKQLLNIIFSDINLKEKGSYKPKPQTTQPVIDFTIINEDEDVYGDYDIDDGEEDAPVIVDTAPMEVDMTDGTAIIEKLIHTFNVKR